MNRLALYGCLGLGIFAMGLGLGLGVNGRHASKKAAQAQTQSDQANGAAQAKAAEAATSERQAAANQAAVNDAGARVAAAKRELARLKAALPQTAPVSIVSTNPEKVDTSQEPVSVSLKYEQVIAAQDQEIAALKLQVSIEHASAVQWHAAYDESQRALALQKIASDAAVHSEHAHGVRAQLVRGLEGLVVGYVAGRVQR